MAVKELFLVAIFAVALAVCLPGRPKQNSVSPWDLNIDSSWVDCYWHDTDMVGGEINNGLNNIQSSAHACQQSCAQDPNCEIFTWSNDDFFDPTYVNSCWFKTKGQATAKSSKGVISGPRECEDPDSDCCKNLNFVSSGTLAQNGQKHTLGTYNEVQEGQAGTYDYQQQGGSNKLYYLQDFPLWYIGDNFGVNMGYVMGQGDFKCPEYNTAGWKAWNWTTGIWELDLTAKFVCASDVPTSHAPVVSTTSSKNTDECNTGAALCGDCWQTSVNGVLYCCKEHCNSGWISVDTTQTPMCRCGL